MFQNLHVLAAAAAHGAEDLSIPEKFGLHTGHIIAQIISFCILAFVLYRFAIKPVLSTMEERQSTIEQGLKDAEDMKAKLADAQAESKEILQKASVEAKGIVDEARKIADEKLSAASQNAVKQAEEIISKARSQIELDRRQMLDDARSEIARLVVATASKVLAKDLSAEDKSRFAESASASLVESSN